MCRKLKERRPAFFRSIARHRKLVLFSALMVLVSCVRVDAEQQQAKRSAVTDKLVTRAKRATVKYHLSVIKLTCLSFEVAPEKFEDKPTVDVREIHNKECGGDPQTSPRSFSVAFDERTGEIWSDAKSLVGQMEMVGIEGTPKK